MARRKKAFDGDREATIEKAKFLLEKARKKVSSLKEDKSSESRVRLRQAAETGWFAMTTAADAYLNAREGKVAGAANTIDVRRVYGGLGPKTRERYGDARGVLHVLCGYSDDKDSCTIASVKTNLRKAGQAIEAVGRSLSNKKSRR